MEPKIKDSEDFTVCLMDLKRKQVGCVLLQAAYGGDRNLVLQIDTEHWFLAPTENMKLYKLSKKQIPEVVELFNSFKRSSKN